MKISVITVCLNSEKTIERTIKSVLAQTYTNIEYIIIDGKSIDNTVGIIKKYETVIAKWISEPDKGLYNAMNKGIAMASGDLIGIINSDDTLYNNRVLEEVAKFHSNNNIAASIGNIVQHNKNGKIIRKYSSQNWHPAKLTIGFMPPHTSIFFKKELFHHFGGYNLGFKIAADYELVTRFFLKYNISWKYSGITTAAMLVGGLSSSGISSYNIITQEMQKSLHMNGITFKKYRIKFRVFMKIKEFLKI